jgi:hypothetical protein
MTNLCHNCHFLAKEYRDGNRPVKLSLTQEEREKVTSNLQEVVPNHYALNCHMGIWDEGISGSAQDRDATINKTSRGDGCFYFPYHPAMLFDAAKELQKRSSENEQLKRSNFYTRVGLWVAAGALVFSALMEFLKNA